MPKHSKTCENPLAWLFKARSNLGAAKRLIKDDDDLLDQAVYHTQQCAGLTMKAFLAFHKTPIQKTHDLDTLCKQCSKFDPSFETLTEKLFVIAPYSTKFRYPDDVLVPYRKETLLAVEYAEEILTFVRRRIEYLSHPNSRIF